MNLIAQSIAEHVLYQPDWKPMPDLEEAICCSFQNVQEQWTYDGNTYLLYQTFHLLIACALGWSYDEHWPLDTVLPWEEE